MRKTLGASQSKGHKCDVPGKHKCVQQTFVAFNFGMQQTMLAGETSVCCLQRWRANKWKTHSKKLTFLLKQFADHHADFIFGCELGGLQQGVAAAKIDMGKIVRSVLPTAVCETSGVYFAVHNCLPAQRTRVTMVQSIVFAIPCGRKVDLFWQIFTVGYRDDDDKETTRGAAQSADSIGKRPLVGLSVRILHITIPSTGSSPSRSTRREIVKRALDFLAGAFNMTKDAAEAATQDAQQPARCELLRRFHGFSQWQLHATENGRSGDLFKERGMRNDRCSGCNLLDPL